MGSGSADKITAASAKISRASILFDKASWVFLYPPPQVPAHAHAGGGKDTGRERGHMKPRWPMARADARFE